MKPQHFTPHSSKRLRYTLLAIAACAVCTSSWARIDKPTEAYISYTVAQGDTLSALSKKLLADPRRWNELAKLNGLKNPHLINPGLVLDVPRSMVNLAAQPEIALTGSLTAVSGQVTMNGQAAQIGTVVPQGARLQAAAGSTAVLRMADGSTVQLMPGTLAEVAKQGGYQFKDPTSSISTTWYSGAIRLLEGALDIVADKKAARATPFNVLTPTSVIGVRGTNFRVAYDDPATQVARTEVLEGGVRSDNPRTGGGANVNGGFGTAFKPADREIKTVPLLPALPTEALPASTQRDYQGTRSAAWNFAAINGASGYKVDVARDAGFTQLVSQYKVNQPSADLTALTNGNYHIRVRGFDGAGIEGYNSARLVTVADALRPPPPPPRAVPWLNDLQRSVSIDTSEGGKQIIRFNLQNTLSPAQMQMVVASDSAFTLGVQRINMARQAVAGGQQFSALLPTLENTQKSYVRFEAVNANGQRELSDTSMLELPGNWGYTVFGVLHPLQPVP